MHRPVLLLPALVLGLALAPSASAAEPGGAPPETVVVHFRGARSAVKATKLPGSGLAERSAAVRAIVGPAAERVVRDHGGAGLEIRRIFLLQPAAVVTAPPDVIRELALHPDVELVEPDHLWRVHTAEGRELIGATEMYRSDFTGDGTAVAVIDTGVDYLHPTLGGGPIPNAKVVRGLDTGDGDDDPMDCGSHGTAVASVAVGSSYQWNPSRWFAGGVAPQARLLAYKASPDAQCGAMSTSAVVAAIEDALLHRVGADYRLAAINISAGSGAFTGPCDEISALYASAVADAVDLGVTVVASSGNDGATDAIAAPACFADVLSVGSYWDQAPGWTGFSFCLDPGCERYCNDSFRPAGSITCYSNVSSYLDLVAPSEYLTTARAGAQTMEFGGTSGAAPYVAGAVALYREAVPGITPAELRVRLAMTGRRRVDDRTGLVTPALRVDRAYLAEHLAIGPPASGPDPSTHGIAVSTAVVDHEIEVGAVHVIVHLAHDEPERLRLTLVSPSGTRVRLHDRGPGSSARSSVTFGGLYALYPDDVPPVDSLARFLGEPAAGPWLLEVVDTAALPPLGTNPQVLGWGLEIEPRAFPAATDPGFRLIVPVVADGAGLNGTRWLTDLRLHATGTSDETAVRLFLVPSGSDGGTTSLQAALRLPAGRVASLGNLVESWFGVRDIVGALVIDSEGGPVMASSRTYNSGGVDGTYGQFIGTLGPEHGVAVGDPPLHALYLADTPGFRANLGVVEVAGRETTAAVTLVDGDSGVPLGHPRFFKLQPFSHLQLNRVVATFGGGGLGNVRAIVAAALGEGRIAAYTSVVDNGTGDASLTLAARATPVDQLVVPVVARVDGAAGTRWASDLRVANLGEQTASVDLEFRWQEGGAEHMTTQRIEVAAGRVAPLDDVVATTLGLDSAVGSLRIVPTAGPLALLAASRTFNRTSDGSYGQSVPGLADGSRDPVEILHLDGDGGWRSNVGICEMSGHDIVLGLELFDGAGSRLGHTEVVRLAPYSLVQLDRIHDRLGAGAAVNCRLVVRQDAGDGSFAAYGSVVDGRTGDAIWVPGQRATPAE